MKYDLMIMIGRVISPGKSDDRYLVRDVGMGMLSTAYFSEIAYTQSDRIPLVGEALAFDGSLVCVDGAEPGDTVTVLIRTIMHQHYKRGEHDILMSDEVRIFGDVFIKRSESCKICE